MNKPGSFNTANISAEDMDADKARYARDTELRTLAVGMYAFRGEFYVDWSGMAAAATISLLPIIIVFLFMQRYFVEGIAGAVKQ